MKTDVRPPNPLLDPMMPALQSHALVSAAAIGLFEALAEGPLAAGDLAKRMGCDALGVLRLAELLTAMGYLTHGTKGFELSALAQATFTSGGEMPLTHWLGFCEIQLQALGHLTAAVRHGKTVDLFDLMADPQTVLTHQRAMAQTARPIAGWVADQIPVPSGARHLLDAGGAHGVYSAAICRRHPPLAAHILELPATLESARQVAREYGSDPYVTHLPGDIRSTPLRNQYAVVFLGNLIHHYTAATLRSVLTTLAAHLEPGGTIAIWDLAVPAKAVDMVGAGFALFFYLTSGAGCHGEAALANALETAGFEDMLVKSPPHGTTHMLVTAKRR